MLIPRQQVMTMIDKIIDASTAIAADKKRDYADVIYEQGRISALLQLKVQLTSLES